jgi:hypothetical protein
VNSLCGKIGRGGGGREAQISNFMKIRPVGADLFHEDRQRDMPKLTNTFPKFANAPEHEKKMQS